MINSVAEVRIDSRGGYKFIVAELTDSNGAKRLVVRADQGCDYHRDILAGLRQEVRSLGLGARCIGGGQISIDPDAKKISIRGSSGDFGVEPDRNETVRMLKEAYPEYQVTR